MTADDDADCVEHVWELQGATLAGDGAHTYYECTRCRTPMVVLPGGVHPQTV